MAITSPCHPRPPTLNATRAQLRLPFHAPPNEDHFRTAKASRGASLRALGESMAAVAQRPGTTSVRLVWPFIALARTNGHDVSHVAAQLGLTAAELEDPETRVPQERIAVLLNGAIERSGIRDIGLLAARYVDGAHLGIGEYLARTRPTLRAAIEGLARYLPLLGDGAGFAFEQRGDRVVSRLWFHPELSIHEAAYEFVVAISVLSARRITGLPQLAPLEVHFMHPRPADVSRHAALFRCPVHFDAEATQTVMSAEFLEMRMASAEPALSALLERQADEMMERLPRDGAVASRVRLLLGGDVPLRAATAERIAQRLGMSVRTLARRLDDEATSYRELLDEARKKLALQELERGRRSIVEIADRLGFASSQSFQRAFKRWTGRAAGRHRKQTRVTGRARIKR
jgi:AraC-like DNA-binding protein